MPRQERVRPARDTNRDREKHRVDRLGDEQVRDALDVCDHPPALGDDAWHVRELVVEKHNLRDGPRRGRAVAHRDADVGVLQRERVVHAVAGHRDHVTASLQRRDDRPLLLRRDPAEDARRVRAPEQALRDHSGARARRPACRRRQGRLAGPPRRPYADCRRRSPCIARPGARSKRACRSRRAGSVPRTRPGHTARGGREAAPPSSSASARASSTTRRPSVRRARSPGSAPDRRLDDRATPSRARRAPTCRARRTSPRSTCAPRRTALRQCAATGRRRETLRTGRGRLRSGSRRPPARRARRRPARRAAVPRCAGTRSRPRSACPSCRAGRRRRAPVPRPRGAPVPAPTGGRASPPRARTRGS